MPVVNISKTLKGEQAIEYLASKYDWNVYCPNYNRMNIIAYRQKRDSAGSLSYDSANEYIFKQDMSMDWDLFIGTALNDDKWSDKGWYEYDSWEGDPFWVIQLYRTSTPFAEWFEENIVDYEIQ
jgi:hypothetical protein